MDSHIFKKKKNINLFTHNNKIETKLEEEEFLL